MDKNDDIENWFTYNKTIGKKITTKQIVINAWLMHIKCKHKLIQFSNYGIIQMAPISLPTIQI